MRIAGTILGIAAAAVLAAFSARADEVVLRATARIAPGADATLADIADLSGPKAEALGDTVIIPASELGAGWIAVPVDRVRAALDARAGIAWGLLSLRGSECSVSSIAPKKSTTVAQKPTGPAGESADGLGTATVKGFIAARIAAALGVEPAKLRLAFDTRDTDLLSMATTGRTIEARITGSSDRVPVRVSIFEGEKLLSSRSMNVAALVQRQIAIVTHDVRRGQILSADDVSREERWIGPELACVAPDDAIGNAAKAALDAGQIVTVNDIQSPVAIKRGDLVTVTSISGGVLVRATARARSGATVGELVDLETLEPDRKHRRTFTARACGRGQAVVSAEVQAVGSPEEDHR